MKQAEGQDLIIADSHAHIFPGKIAQKATENIGHFYDIPMQHCGMSGELIKSGEEIGVRKYLVCSTATRPAQVQAINDFIYGECQKFDCFLGFATLHAYMDEPEREIDRILELGLHGVKLHPDFQLFDIDDAKAIPIYRRLAEVGLPVLFHTGDDRYEYSAPGKLARACDQVPELVCIAAHFGGYRRWEEAHAYLKRQNVHFDTSSSLFCLPKEEALGMIAFFGEDQFLFGSDFPMWDHKEELARFLSLGLAQETRDKILYKNFEKLFRVAVK